MKQFKARIEGLTPLIHAIEVWLEAGNIMQAGHTVMDIFHTNGIRAENIVQLIELDDR